MLIFIIAFRPASTTKSFDRVCQLLQVTLSSVANQTSRNFRVYVICHDPPSLGQRFDYVNVIGCPFRPPPDNVLELDQAEARRLMRTDKARKNLFGLSIARDYRGSHVMFLDYDDLVSSRLASLVESTPESCGWFFNTGYLMFSRDPRWMYARRCFHHECGSSHILKTCDAPFPAKLDFSLGLEDYFVRRYHVHAHLADSMKNKGTPLLSLPFPGAVYLCHNENALINDRDRNAGLRKWMRWIFKGVRVNEQHRSEFCIPKKFGVSSHIC